MVTEVNEIHSECMYGLERFVGVLAGKHHDASVLLLSAEHVSVTEMPGG